MQRYVGIADAHGLESFIPEGQTSMFALQMRALANRQRHALLYRVELGDEVAKDVQGALDADDYMLALKLIQAQPGVEVEKQMQRSWKMIPNHDLDPYYGGGEECLKS